MTSNCNVPATLSVTLEAYPVPSSNEIVWRKCRETTCSDIDQDKHFYVSTDGLVSNLTIFNVTETSFGQYELHVTNAIGIA